VVVVLLIRKTQLTPEGARGPQVTHRATEIFVGEPDGAARQLGAGMRSRPIQVFGDRAQLANCILREDGIARGQRDLDLCREQLCALHRRPRRVSQRPAQRGQGGRRLPLGESHQCQARLWVASKLVRPTERLFRAGEVATPTTQLPQRDERLRRRSRLEPRQLVAGCANLGLGLVPGAAQAQDLTTVDPTDPVERRGRWQRCAPRASSVGPLRATSDVGDLAAFGDERAVHGASEVVIKLTAQHERHRLVQRRASLVMPPLSDEDAPLLRETQRDDPLCAVSIADLDRIPGTRFGLIERASVQRQLRVGERDKAVLGVLRYRR
jgi:hypothetical protein